MDPRSSDDNFSLLPEEEFTEYDVDGGGTANLFVNSLDEEAVNMLLDDIGTDAGGGTAAAPFSLEDLGLVDVVLDTAAVVNQPADGATAEAWGNTEYGNPDDAFSGIENLTLPDKSLFSFDAGAAAAPALDPPAQNLGGGEERFCVCNQVAHGDMVGCDNDNCATGNGWFHYGCVGLTAKPAGNYNWYCPVCSAQRQLCSVEGCERKSRNGMGNLCIQHGGARCKVDGCKTSARGTNGLCKKHGGGRRCAESGCKSSAEGATSYCIRHGGGASRCSAKGCHKMAKKRGFCVTHLVSRDDDLGALMAAFTDLCL